MDERPHRYRYYLLGQVTPVRVSIDRQGLIMAAEVPVVSGGFRYDITYLSRLRDGDEVEETDGVEFEAKAAAFRRQQNERLRKP